MAGAMSSASPTLDVEAVQAFVLVADFQSFTRAAQALDTSQAAISIKLKQLEGRLGEKLIERTPRLVRLSARGAAFLGPAREFLAAHQRAVAGLSTTSRRFALGIADQVAGRELPALLVRLHAQDPAFRDALKDKGRVARWRASRHAASRDLPVGLSSRWALPWQP